MSSAQFFKSASKKPAPFSLRLTDKEKAKLLKRAKGKPLGAYIKSQLFNSAAKGAELDKVEIARMIAGLGSSDLSRSMARIAKSAELGSLPVTPELLGQLQNACKALHYMRLTLIQMQGMKPK